MRKVLPAILENCRVKYGRWASNASHGPNGIFLLYYQGFDIKVMASDGSSWKEEGLKGEPWEHVSVSLKRRIPSWEEMCYVKNLFWAEDETVIQLHPPEDKYINAHSNVLHLWKPPYEVPLPPAGTLI